MSDPTELLHAWANPKTTARQSYYRLTTAGRRLFKKEVAYWPQVSDGISSALVAPPEDL